MILIAYLHKYAAYLGCCNSDSKMCILANSEDPDEMPHSVAFHQDLHCLLNRKRYSEKEIQSYLEIITCDPSIYTEQQKKGIFCIFGIVYKLWFNY